MFTSKLKPHLITPVHKHVYFLFLQQVNMQVQNVSLDIGTQHEVPKSTSVGENWKLEKGIATSHTSRVHTVFTQNGGEKESI